MKQVPLSAKVRDVRGSSRSRRLRSQGFVPAEVYGHKEPNQSIQVPEKEFSRILTSAQGENIFFSLAVEGGKGEPFLAVLKEVQYNKRDHSLLHADFHKVKMNERIRIRIPVRIQNAELCEGVKTGGVLQTLLRALEVQCLPTEIPEAVTVDATNLKVGDSVHVSDLKLPAGVKAVTSSGAVVVSVAAQMAEEVKAEVAPAPGAAPAAGEPEVLTAKKKEEGAEAPKAEAGKAEAKPAEKKPAEKK